jgi:hypothetical protein
MQSLTLKVAGKRAFSVRAVQQCAVPIRTKRAREHTDVPKHALEGFIQDVTHLVLEILTSSKWRSKKERTSTPSVDADFSASAANVFVLVEALPKLIDRSPCGFRTDVKENANVWLDEGAKCVEEPAAPRG